MEHIKSSVEALSRQLLAAMPEEERVMAAWPQVCGAKAAEHARAESFAGGVLRVRVNDAAWLATLGHLRGQYCARLREMTGVAVEKLEFESTAANLRA
jgi:predicted nucleic acid-binding Zn ribbon protein